MSAIAWEAFAGDYVRGELIEPHAHDLAQIVFAKQGVMRVQTRDGAWVVPPQRALWMPAGLVHWIHCPTAVAMRTVYLDPGALGRQAPGPAVLAVSPLLREVLLRLVEGGPGDRGAFLTVLVGELAAVPVAPLHLPEPRDPRLRRLCAALADDPGNPATLAEHSRAAGASIRTVARLFTAETGMGFRAWQRQLRLLVALERLADGQPVTRVALDLGYGGPSAFIASFRAVLGTTPARYFRIPAAQAGTQPFGVR
jgi:AraC-like DNA-binding protein